MGVKAKSQKGTEYPKETDYFILDPETPDQKRRQALIEQFHELYGEKPKAIKIMFPPAAPELFFAQFYKRYGKSTLVKCKGDGEIATTTPEFAEGLEQIGEDDRGFIQVKCLGPDCPYQIKNECGRMASLQVILPELSGVGIWQINTGSYNSIVNMNSAIEWLNGLCGRYAMIPLTLMRVPQDIQYEGKKSKHYILQIDQNISIGEIQKFAMLTPVERALIPAPDEKKDDQFFDAAGKKPPQIEDQSEEAPETAPGAPTIDVPAEAVKEPDPAPKAPEKPKAQAQGPMAAAFEKDQASRKLMADLQKGIGTCKERAHASEYIAKLKKDGHLDALLPAHKDELRAWTIKYLKGLTK